MVSSAHHSRTLSESASKALLREAGVPMADEREVATAELAAQAASEIGFPVVAKLFTFGGLGIWALIDFILIALRKVPDRQGKPLS